MRGWETLGFTDVCREVSRGNTKVQKSALREAGRFPVVDQGEAEIAGYTDDERNLFKGTTPVILFGDHTRRFKFVDFRFAIGADGVKVLSPADGIDPRYLYWCLRSTEIPSAGYSRHFKFLKNRKIPVPPFDEQRRIARVLDAADSLRAKRQTVVGLLGEMRRAAFAKVVQDAPVSGYELGEVLDRIESGTSPVCDTRAPEAGEWGILKLGAVSSGVYRPSESKALLPGANPRAENEVRAGDVLLARKNTRGLVGASAYVRGTPRQLLLPDLIFRLVLSDEAGIEPQYLQAALAQPGPRAQISRLAGGSAGSMPNISKARLAQVRIEVPPAQIQRAYLDQLRRLDQQEVAGSMAMERLDELFASLQARAFAGEL